METWSQRIDRYILEGRTVSGGKGADKADQQRKEELAMQKEAFQKQMESLGFIKGGVGKYVSGSEGYDPATLAAMRSSFLNSNNATFNQAGQQVRDALRARGASGGTNPVGGDYVRGISSLVGAKASNQSSGLLNLKIQDALQALTNKFNAANLISGNAATLTGTQGVAGAGASSALGDYIRAKNTGFLSSFTNAFGGSLGKTLGTFGGQSGPGGTSYSWGG